MYDSEIAEVVEYHHAMLGDVTRTKAFLKAILETVRPGDVVLDLGTGTGVLASFACFAGARHVYAVEHGPVIGLARRMIERNGLTDRITLIKDWSTSVRLPELADVLVTETIGNVGFDEGILGWVIDAKRRLLRPGAQLVPQAVELVLAPVEAPQPFDVVHRWADPVFTLDYSPAREVAASNLYWAELSRASLLAEPASGGVVELDSATLRRLKSRASFEIKRAGTIHGLGGWFRARLSRSVSIDTTPPNQSPSWSHGLFPLAEPITVATGDHIDVVVDVRDNGADWSWTLTAKPPSSAPIIHRSGQGALHAEARLWPLDYRPRRTEAAALDALTLSLIDGEATLGEIATAVRASFPAQLPTTSHAVAYVEEIVREYAG
jgi:protein arginine N-methyltransferase 1